MHLHKKYANCQFVNIQAKALEAASHCADKMSPSTKTLVNSCMQGTVSFFLYMLF